MGKWRWKTEMRWEILRLEAVGDRLKFPRRGVCVERDCEVDCDFWGFAAAPWRGVDISHYHD